MVLKACNSFEVLFIDQYTANILVYIAVSIQYERFDTVMVFMVFFPMCLLPCVWQNTLLVLNLSMSTANMLSRVFLKINASWCHQDGKGKNVFSLRDGKEKLRKLLPYY